MTEERTSRSDDIMAVATPDFVDLDNPEHIKLWSRTATGLSKQWVWAQYQKPPFDLEFNEDITVLITSSPDEVDQFYDAHAQSCEVCRAGMARVKEFLALGGASATLVRIPVTEVW